MTMQELIGTINALIDADVAEGTVLDANDIARRAIDRCGEGVFEDVTGLVYGVIAVRGVMLILEAGWQADEPVALILAKVRHAYRGITDETLAAQIEAYMSWMSRDPLGGLRLRACGDCDA